MEARRVFVVTGGSSGIGAAVVRRAASQGHAVVVGARASERLLRLADEPRERGEVVAVPCDVNEWDQQQELVRRALETFGRIDVVVANAGCELGSPLIGGSHTPDAWRQMILTNVYGLALTIRATAPSLVEAAGDLVLMGSVAGRVAIPGDLYSATKWAVTGIAESIRRSLVGTGVRVILIEPGRVDTQLRRDDIAAPRLDPDDVADAVLFAVGQPRTVAINEIVMRPVHQEV
jgi:NADP-dependent 3-hydroxy acid dehydrogenase YdfG